MDFSVAIRLIIMRKIGILLGVILGMIACTESNNKENTTEANDKVETTEASTEEASAEVPEDPLFAEGKANYETYCMSCHMKDGYGVPNLNPPLAETAWVTGDEDTLIDIVLNGRTGDIEVNGEIYSGVMIPHSHLSDQEIASILTYIRSSFGNKSGPISEKQVATVRAKL